MSGVLFLIPTYLSDSNDRNFIAPVVVDVLKNTKCLLVENARTARRFVASLKAGIEIDDLSIEILDKRSTWDDIFQQLTPLQNGQDVGLLSEAGLPCLADPGNLAVSVAHQIGSRVVPLPGASSIQLALIASGFNGQQFTFHGYLPIDKGQRSKKLKELEREAGKGYTQLFMETPYRNEQLLQDILKNCHPDLHLSVAADISGKGEIIKTISVAKWKKKKISLHKVPAIFSFGQFA